MGEVSLLPARERLGWMEASPLAVEVFLEVARLVTRTTAALSTPHSSSLIASAKEIFEPLSLPLTEERALTPGRLGMVDGRVA